MISREEIFAYVKDKYHIEPDYPWVRTPNYAIFRHKTNRKWFGAIVDITEDKLGLGGNKLIDILLVKCDPVLIGSLRNEGGILPAYHMNKEHWITILLDGTYPKESMFTLIGLSYDLTK
ncbi:MAG: MmcQ/YjbR family DNA-binding protein [Methanomicrobiales archaeon]|jgi:predicted DNA-binding protein (MmcQ/YjbR family)|nr:MmcQ/YjbR family DNA-binding protein [Methanomicrobiales archaeon]